MRSKQLSFFGDLPPKPKPRRAGAVLTVLPDAARVEARLSALAAQSGLAAGPLACTFAQLQEAVIGVADSAQTLRPAPRLVRTLLYRRLARERTPAGSVWHAIRGEPGFARALGALSSVLAEGLLSPAALLALCPELPAPVRSRVEPLARVLAAGELELRAAGLCEPGEAVRAACERLRAGGPLPPLLRAAGAVHLAAVLDWTPARLELLFALAARLGQGGVKVQLQLPYWPRRPFLSGDPLGPVLSRIEALGAQAAQGQAGAQSGALPELVYQQPGSDGPLAPFRERLFAEGSALEEAPEGLSAAQVQLVSCAGPAAQAREVARRVADQLDAGCAPDQIAVAVRSLAGGAAEELGAALEQLGIPWRERRGRPALPTPPVQLALSLYQLAEREFPRAQLSALLGSGLLWLREEGERAGSGAIDRVLREAAVRDDRGAAEGETGAIAAQLARLAERKGRAAQAEERERRREGLLRELAEVEEVGRRAVRAIGLVRSLPERASAAGHGKALLALLDQLGLAERLRRGPRALDERGPQPPPGPLERALESARARDLGALDALGRACRELAQAAALLGRAAEELARGDFARLLAEALSEASLRPGGARGCAVELVELRELPGRSFTHLHVAGLVDGELPAQPAGDPLLSDEDKRAINRAARRAIFRAPAEGESPVLPQRQAEEPLLFALGLAAATRSLTLLWPRADALGREVLRSPFADEAARAAGLAPGDGEAASEAGPGPALVRARLAPVPHLSDCRSPQALLGRALLEGLSEPAFRLSAPASPALGRGLLRAVLEARATTLLLAAGLRRAGRAALAERERVRAFVGQIAPGRFSGQLTGAALALVQPAFAFGLDAPLSATLLEHDATCPFRTLGRTLLGLDDDDPPDEVLSPRDRGSLLHGCLEAFFSALGPVPLRAGPEELALLEQTASEVLGRAERTQHVGHPGLWKIERTLVLRQLEAVVRAEAAAGSRALHLEQRFGYATGSAEGEVWPALQLPSPEGDGAALFVRGAIDRVDQAGLPGQLRAVGPDGDTGGPLLVLDYKSGGIDGVNAKASADRWLLPEHQLLLYAAAVQARYPGRPVDATLLSLRHAERSRSLAERAGKSKIDLAGLLALDPGRRGALRAQTPRPPNLADAVWERVRRLRQGTLPAAPLDCDHCHLRPVCRVAALPVLEEVKP